MTTNLRFTILPLLLSASACSVSSQDHADDADGTGTIEAALTSAPAGVACISITISGSTSTSQKFSVTSGQSTLLAIGALNAGTVNVNAAAFGQTCANVTSTTVPSWSSIPTSATVQPGIPTTVNIVLRPVLSSTGSVSFAPAAIAIAAGQFSTAAVLEDGTVRQWGSMYGGQNYVPVQIAGVAGAKSVALSTGGFHSCALTANGAYCWGANFDGQLGDGTNSSSVAAVKVNSPVKFTQLALGMNHTCAIGNPPKTDVYCWGRNDQGQLMDGTTTSHSLPTALNFGFSWSSASSYVTASDNYSCLLLGGSDAYCAGLNDSGQFANNKTSTTPQPTPSQAFYSNSVAIAAAPSFTCAVAANGTVHCAGSMWGGGLGDGTQTASTSPVAVTGLTDVVAIAPGQNHVCTLKRDGTVWCWGYGADGQIGDSQGAQRLTAVQVPSLTGVTSIASGLFHTCALKTDGTMWCWGGNDFGQLGDGTIVSRFAPVQVQF